MCAFKEDSTIMRYGITEDLRRARRNGFRDGYNAALIDVTVILRDLEYTYDLTSGSIADILAHVHDALDDALHRERLPQE